MIAGLAVATGINSVAIIAIAYEVFWRRGGDQ
jgi:hypothetical protein